MSALTGRARPEDAPTSHRVSKLTPDMAQLIAGIDARKPACERAHRRMKVNITGSRRYPRR